MNKYRIIAQKIVTMNHKRPVHLDTNSQHLCLRLIHILHHLNMKFSCQSILRFDCDVMHFIQHNLILSTPAAQFPYPAPILPCLLFSCSHLLPFSLFSLRMKFSSKRQFFVQRLLTPDQAIQRLTGTGMR